MPKFPDNQHVPDEEFDIISKSQLKRDAEALQVLGERLADLSTEHFNKLVLPEALREAVKMARSLPKRGARKRQLQYVGRLMRNVEAEPIAKQLDAILHVSHEATRKLHDLEQWRTRLLAEGDPALDELLQQCPTADRQHLRQLLRNASKEQAANKPPQSARALFKYLRELFA